MTLGQVIAVLLFVALLHPAQANVVSSGHYANPKERLCSHPWLPAGTRMEVCRGKRCFVCRVNGRQVR